jgi:hypothetical protein
MEKRRYLGPEVRVAAHLALKVFKLQRDRLELLP